MNVIEERTVALAGLLQACMQVQSVARTGAGNQDVIDNALRSILILDAASTPAVFGGLQALRPGLSLLAEGILVSPDGDKVELLRYAMSLLNLEVQLLSDNERFTQFSQQVERLSSEPQESLERACARIYQDYISSLKPQVIVQGEQDFLQREDIPVTIRSLLLAGIRAAVLWRQKGGGRFKLLWERTRMRNAAQSLLASL